VLAGLLVKAPTFNDDCAWFMDLYIGQSGLLTFYSLNSKFSRNIRYLFALVYNLEQDENDRNRYDFRESK
jgi:hypothetical protein